MAAITQAADDEDGDAMILTSPPPPQDILDEILQTLNDCCCRQDERYQIEEINEAKSAQQQVYILRFALVNNGDFSKDLQPKYHRQEPPTDRQVWTEAPESGHNRLVLRLWKGGSQWWNLHRNASPTTLARQEIMGYRVARHAFEIDSKRQQRQNLRIPRVLCFHENVGGTPSSSSNPRPWAVLEYVGPDSSQLETSQLDSSYLGGMVKIRTEFGFEEPHPRWGRVPLDQALEYALIILHQVMLPLHQRTRRQFEELSQSQSASDSDHDDDETTSVYTYASMVNVYKSAVQPSMAVLESKIQKGDTKTAKCLNHLNGALNVLESNSRSTVPQTPQLSPVLVHMDLQPQNLIFCKKETETTMDRSQDNNMHYDSSYRQEKGNSDHPTVSAILDWEDAAWADPRFDLLLLCRKVCANRDQAKSVWTEYANALSNDEENDATSVLGPIEPWLQLESVHSTVTLLLQSMDLLNGGRNPWETSSDVWGKLEREFVRWEGYAISS